MNVSTPISTLLYPTESLVIVNQQYTHGGYLRIIHDPHDNATIDAAATSDRMGTARTFVWADNAKRVVAYFSLCPHEIHRETVPITSGHGPPRVIPTILLARFALDRTLHGQGFGRQLLIDALSRAVTAINAAGGRLIVVDALHERAAAFYSHHGFAALPSTPLRLVMKLSATSLVRG